MPKNWQRKRQENFCVCAVIKPVGSPPTAMQVTFQQNSKEYNFCDITDNMTVEVSKGERVIVGPWDEMTDMLQSAAAKMAAQKNAAAEAPPPA
jgi:hypothetical protein